MAEKTLADLFKLALDELNEREKNFCNLHEIKFKRATWPTIAFDASIDVSDVYKVINGIKINLKRETVLRLVVVLRARPDLARRIFEEAGYSIDGHTLPSLETYRKVIDEVQSLSDNEIVDLVESVAGIIVFSKHI